jgi:predicted RNA polymerase sigma factor
VIDPSDHLFWREAGRLVATLTRIFGVHNLALAEDVVQDAFCRALEVWKFRGVPENPSAWLMATANAPRAPSRPSWSDGSKKGNTHKKASATVSALRGTLYWSGEREKGLGHFNL